MKSVNSSKTLMAIVDQILDQHPQGIREYDLIIELDTKHNLLYPKPDLRQPLLLFQHHFFLRHTLYLLQQQHAEQRSASIEISTLTITKLPPRETLSTLPEQQDPLRDYYLDLTNLNKEDDLSVQAMLDQFWLTMQRQSAQPDAYRVLGLTGSESNEEKQARYRQLAQQQHPDKGGDSEKFCELQHAWQQIKPR